jgi:hypothetical protein
MGLSNALRAASRGVSSSAYARMALPALTAPAKKPSMMSAIFGQSAGPAMPPMDQPVPGLVLPDPPAAPAAAPATLITTLANGAKIASEDTQVRRERDDRSRKKHTRRAAHSCAGRGGPAPPASGIGARRDARDRRRVRLAPALVARDLPPRARTRVGRRDARARPRGGRRSFAATRARPSSRPLQRFPRARIERAASQRFRARQTRTPHN